MAELGNSNRVAVGIWTEWPDGARWHNEGMTRLLGFLIEGVAEGNKYVFRLVIPDSIKAEAIDDLKGLKAKLGLDYTVHSPSDAGVKAGDFRSLAKFANTHVNVEGWIVLFPYFRHALLLDKPLATVFPDAIPVVFPVPDEGAWGAAGYHFQWKNLVNEMLTGSHRVITFSDHVAREQATGIFGTAAARIRVVPHAPPNLSHLLPWIDPKQKNAQTTARAGEMLRQHARERKWEYLADFPFEEVPYIAISTQDRVTKNIRIAAESLNRLVREKRLNYKVFMTAPVHFGATWTPLPNFLEQEQLNRDVASMTDLPRDVHAALYHCARLTVHPSIFEGGHGPFPFYESVSVGTPCLMARGPHVVELLNDAPELEPFTFDANDANGLASLMLATIDDSDRALQVQQNALEQLGTRSWQQVAAAYADAATEVSAVSELNRTLPDV